MDGITLVAVAACVGIIASLSGVILGWNANAKSNKKEVVDSTTSSVRQSSDMEYLKRGVDEIRVDQRAMRNDMALQCDRITRVEESTKSAHKRIDRLEKTKEGE